MRRSLVIIFVVLSALGGAQNPIDLNENTANTSMTSYAVILEDNEDKYSIDDILNDETLQFEPVKNDIGNLDFTTSTWWVKFKVTNRFEGQGNFILETARPITNIVELYSIGPGGEVTEVQRTGDGLSYDVRPIDHRKCLFNLDLEQNETRTFVIKVKSDGEMVTLPLIFWEPGELMNATYEGQFGYGLYFGILFFVALIYFIFFLNLRERSFLYYVLYVVSLFFLQFSLDGFTFQYLFPDNIWWANHMVVLSAGLSVLFVLLYARTFLKVAERQPKVDLAYKLFMGLVALITIGSLTGGILYIGAFPAINGTSLFALLFIIATIATQKAKGFRVDNFFATAFVVLISGAVIFILGNFNVIREPALTQNALMFASATEVIFLSISMANKYRELQREKQAAQEEAMKQLKEKNKLMDEINIKLEQQVAKRTAELREQKEIVEEKNTEILDSIKYAQRIQDAILPRQSAIDRILPESFILFKPRDIVSGDFYFVAEVTPQMKDTGKLALFAAVDCTGHGVPGAFMSIVGNNFLELGLQESEVNTPGEALDFLNKGVGNTLRQELGDDDTVRDGMDIALCALDRQKNLLHFAGAKNPVYIIREQGNPPSKIEEENMRIMSESGYNLLEVKADKQPIGAYVMDHHPFTTRSIQLRKGDTIYLFSDGYADQFGGDKGKKMNYKRFKRKLIEIQPQPMARQKATLDAFFEEWRGKHEQLDDVCVIGVRV